MKGEITIRVRNTTNGREWDEFYNDLYKGPYKGSRGVDPPDVNDDQSAFAWGKRLIDWFNSTAREGESRRELLSAKYTSGAK